MTIKEELFKIILMKNRQIDHKLSKDELVAELRRKNIFDSTFNIDGKSSSDFILIKHSGTEMIRNKQILPGIRQAQER